MTQDGYMMTQQQASSQATSASQHQGHSFSLDGLTQAGQSQPDDYPSQANSSPSLFLVAA